MSRQLRRRCVNQRTSITMEEIETVVEIYMMKKGNISFCFDVNDVKYIIETGQNPLTREDISFEEYDKMEEWLSTYSSKEEDEEFDNFQNSKTEFIRLMEDDFPYLPITQFFDVKDSLKLKVLTTLLERNTSISLENISKNKGDELTMIVLDLLYTIVYKLPDELKYPAKYKIAELIDQAVEEELN
mgnify:CR=1 FL=1